MVCETRLKARQTPEQRKEEVRKAIVQLEKDIAARLVKARVGPQGAIAFEGWKNEDGVSDACAYRQIMIKGSALARAEIARAEQMAGRGVSKEALNSGIHSHDSGKTWNNGH
jgi:hypothetical protein